MAFGINANSGNRDFCTYVYSIDYDIQYNISEIYRILIYNCGNVAFHITTLREAYKCVMEDIYNSARPYGEVNSIIIVISLT